jgi:hypothetical protein
VSGRLSYNNSAIPSAKVFLRSSIDNGDTWEDFALEQTRADGSFNMIWIPKTTGNYLLCAYWEGNNTLRWMNTTQSLALTTDSSGKVFSASSNATITDLKYDSATQTLGFNTNTTQTSTPITITIPKTLIDDTQTLQIKIDGKTTTTFSSKAQDDLWIITCQADQGKQSITIKIPQQSIMSPNTTPWLYIAIVIIALIIIVAIVTTIRRRRKTAATVAAILKETRQT